MEHARHVFRVLLVLVLGLAGFIAGRSFLVPKSYGTYGSYRYDNVAEQMKKRPPLHGGAASCAECHDDKAKVLKGGAHATVNCEVCHGPLGKHVRDGMDVFAKPVIDRSPKLCGYCHKKIDGRPEKFPQVVFEKHVEGGLGPKGCLDCHEPHSPKL